MLEVKNLSQQDSSRAEAPNGEATLIVGMNHLANVLEKALTALKPGDYAIGQKPNGISGNPGEDEGVIIGEGQGTYRFLRPHASDDGAERGEILQDGARKKSPPASIKDKVEEIQKHFGIQPEAPNEHKNNPDEGPLEI